MHAGSQANSHSGLGRENAGIRLQALEVLRKLAASSDANLGSLQAAGAVDALLELLGCVPPASGRAAGAVHLLRDIALYAPPSRCAAAADVPSQVFGSYIQTEGAPQLACPARECALCALQPLHGRC